MVIADFQFDSSGKGYQEIGNEDIIIGHHFTFCCPYSPFLIYGEFCLVRRAKMDYGLAPVGVAFLSLGTALDCINQLPRTSL